MPTVGVSHGPVLAFYSLLLLILNMQVGLYHLQTLSLKDPSIDGCRSYTVLLYIVRIELEIRASLVGPLHQLEIQVFHALG